MNKNILVVFLLLAGVGVNAQGRDWRRNKTDSRGCLFEDGEEK